MIIRWTPVRSDDPFEVSVAGDVLTINGENFDFGPLEENSVLPYEAINSIYFTGEATRIGGQIVVDVVLFLKYEASEAARFPQPQTVGDGPVEYPV